MDAGSSTTRRGAATHYSRSASVRWACKRVRTMGLESRPILAFRSNATGQKAHRTNATGLEAHRTKGPTGRKARRTKRDDAASTNPLICANLRNLRTSGSIHVRRLTFCERRFPDAKCPTAFLAPARRWGISTCAVRTAIFDKAGCVVKSLPISTRISAKLRNRRNWVAGGRAQRCPRN